jgi:hypothetical protein
MKDIEIYELAGQVLGTLTRELNDGIYAKLGGELTIRWCEVRTFGAYASSSADPAAPVRHSITIYYELVRQVWRDAEGLCEFLRSIPEGTKVDSLYDFYGDRGKLPTCFEEDEHVKNMFVAAITWVFFHELGHLMQEHGVIRAEFGSTAEGLGLASDVQDFEASGDEILVGREAVVSHTTELAADFEAMNFYVFELLRHVRDPEFIRVEDRTEILAGLVYLMVCGLSLVFFRFNGAKPLAPNAVVEGSHPNPLTRLEINLTQIHESLDSKLMRTICSHNMDRKELVILGGKAALSATLYWTMTVTESRKLDERFMMKGLLTNSTVLEYLQPIVACWDEMLPRVLKLRRFGAPTGVMTFTDSFRHRIAEVIPWGKGPEGASQASVASTSYPDHPALP